MTSTRLSLGLLPLALPFAAPLQAADVNAITNNGDWMAAATWSDNAVPTSANSYFVPGAIGIDGDARTENQGSSTRTFTGAALTIQNGGALYLDSVHNSSFPTWTYTIPNLTLQDGASLHVRGGAGTIFTLTNGFTVAPNSTVAIRHSGGNYDQRLTLGAITGPSTSTIQIIASQFSSNSGINSKDNYANAASSTFAGNWFLDATATLADKNVRLRADAANALGTGAVTVGRKAILENNINGGFDSLSKIELQNDTSQVKFNNRDWTAPVATLTVTDGIATVGTSQLSLASISQAWGEINMTVGGTKDGKLITSGNADFTGGEINLTYLGNPAGKSFDIVTYGGTLVTPPFIDTGDTGRVFATVNNGSGTNGKVTVSFAGTAANLTWLGNEPGFESDWDSSVALNWSNGGSPDTFRNFDSVTFGNTTGSTTPNVIGTLLPGSVTFNHSTNDYTLGGTGSIGGIAALTKSGTGTLTITAANGFSGGTTLNAGKLRIGSNTALGTGALTINGGSISSNGTIARTLALPVTLNAPATLGDATDNGALTLSGVITDGTGSFSIAKQGAGTLTLTGANTYDGGTTISEGKIRVGNNAALGTGPLTIGGGALTSDGTTARTLANPVTIGNSFGLGNLTDTGAVNLSGPITLAGNATISAESATEMTFSGIISGTGNLEYSRDAANPVARLNLNNTGNTFTGNLTVTSGRLRFASGASSDGAWGNASNKIIFNGTPVENFNHNEGTASIQQSTGGAGTIAATREVVINAGKEGTFDAWGSQTLTVNAPVTGGGRLRKEDVGTLLLAGNNTYSGGTRNTNGIIRVTNNNGLGTGDVTVGAVNNTLTARVDLEGVTVSNNFMLNSLGLTGFFGPLTAGGGLLSTVNGNVTISSGVGNGGHLASNGTGSILRVNGEIIVLNGIVPNVRQGTVILAGGGTYPRLDQGQGTLQIGANNGISSVAELRLAISGPGTFDLNGYQQTLSQLTRAAAQTTTVTNSAATASVLTIDGTTSHSYNGTINNGTGGLSLVKNGSSIFTLATATTYNGGTSVQGGTLRFNAATGTGAVTVESAGTLGGTGPVNGTVSVGGTLAPGNSAGTLTASSTLTFGPSSTYAWEVDNWTGAAGTGWDLVNAATLAFTATPSNKLTIAISGTATNFTEGPKTFVIASSTNPITGFNPAAIQINAGAFAGTGTWSAQANGNSIELVYAPGSGNPFSTWASANGIPANAALDSDGDGIPDGIEFVIGGDPSGPNSDSNSLLPTITTDATYLNFTYRRTDEAAGMPQAQQPYVQYGSGLSGWTQAEGGVNGVTISEVNSTPDLVTVKIPRSLAAGGKLFARLRVDLE